jgi:hypothetical protein
MMSKQLKHSTTVYKGRVGARMRAPRVKPEALHAPVPKTVDRVCGGPYGGDLVPLTASDGIEPTSFVFTARGKTGHYQGGLWVPVKTL